jgi:ubiquitin-activating enzyme E1
VEVLRSGFVNLAVNVYSLGEPGAPKKTRSVEFDPIACGPVKARPEGFTRWDKVVLREGSLTPLQLEAALAKLFPGCAVNMITSGKSILYNPLLYKAHKEQRANKPLVDIAAGVPGAAPLPPGRKYLILDVSCFDDDGDVLIPQVQMYFE